MLQIPHGWRTANPPQSTKPFKCHRPDGECEPPPADREPRALRGPPWFSFCLRVKSFLCRRPARFRPAFPGALATARQEGQARAPRLTHKYGSTRTSKRDDDETCRVPQSAAVLAAAHLRLLLLTQAVADLSVPDPPVPSIDPSRPSAPRATSPARPPRSTPASPVGPKPSRRHFSAPATTCQPRPPAPCEPSIGAGPAGGRAADGLWRGRIGTRIEGPGGGPRTTQSRPSMMNPPS